MRNMSHMTFRKMTFIFIALLLSLLFLLQFWLIQNFTKDVSSKIGEAAFEVSLSTTKALIFRQPKIKFRSFGISTHITKSQQIEIIDSLSRVVNDIQISLQDGQKDNFLIINFAGTKQHIDIPRTGIQNSLDEMSNKILLSAISFIFLGLFVANYFARQLARPLTDLQQASQKVGLGDFGFQIKNNLKFQSVELTNTVSAFNEMSKKIERLQSENEALQKQAQLSELAEITRGLAHTIRNPLNTLNLAIDELSCSKDESEKLELTKISKHQIQRIDKWVRSLMDLMSNDTNLIEEVDVEKLLYACIDDTGLNNAKKISIDLQINNRDNLENSVLSILAIKPELKSLLQALINNSVEATQALKQKEKNASNIKIELEKLPEALQITFTDHGIGFSKKIRDNLFSPHNTDKTYGAGMGLYLAHRIATLKYSGDIKINDNPDDNSKNLGTKIVLTLKNRV